MIKGKWSLLLVVVMIGALIAGCAKEKSEEEKLAEALQSALGSNVVKEGTPEAMLGEIRSYVTKDIWNDGLVNVSWYLGKGTSSTGETLDIEFTMERLGKAIEKKAEYNEYINGLDAKYDSVKQVWNKLSAEIDNLYGQIKDKTPVANDKEANAKFDTGLFSQYSEAFRDEVNELKKAAAE